MDKENVGKKKNIYIYITLEYYSAFKKREISPYVTTEMDLEDIVLREVSQALEDKDSMTSRARGI